MLDLVRPPGGRKLCEDIPPDQLLTAADAHAARAAITAADTVVLQLQQPADTLTIVARAAAAAGARIVLDGAPNRRRCRRRVLVWPAGERFFPRGPDPALDPTGGGDAFVAGLVHGLRRGWSHAPAGHRAPPRRQA